MTGDCGSGIETPTLLGCLISPTCWERGVQTPEINRGTWSGLLYFLKCFYCISSDKSLLPDIQIDNVIYIVVFLLPLYQLSPGVIYYSILFYT